MTKKEKWVYLDPLILLETYNYYFLFSGITFLKLKQLFVLTTNNGCMHGKNP